MSNKQKVLELLRENPRLTNEQLAAQLSTTKGVVATAVWKLRKAGDLPAFEGYAPVRADRHVGLEQECEAVGIPINSVGHYWYKGKHYSIHAKLQGKSYFELQDEIIGAMIKHAPKYPKIKYTKQKGWTPAGNRPGRCAYWQIVQRL